MYAQMQTRCGRRIFRQTSGTLQISLKVIMQATVQANLHATMLTTIQEKSALHKPARRGSLFRLVSGALISLVTGAPLR